MRQRKSATGASQADEAAAPFRPAPRVAPATATTSSSASPMPTAVQRHRSRLEGVEGSYYYTPQLMWLQVMDRIPYNVSHYFVPATPPHHELMLRRLREQHVRPYAKEHQADVELLSRLWNGHNRVMFAPADLTFSADAHTVHDRWKEMGFQGRDPSTDFRGAGAFGLAQLVYLIEAHPDQWSTMLTPDFMLAAAGLNVTMRLVTLLGISPSQNQFSATALSTYSACEARLQLCRFMSDPDLGVALRRLNEVYCFAMRLLHYRWMRSSRNIMEFNQQLGAMNAELERLLYVSRSLEDLCALV